MKTTIILVLLVALFASLFVGFLTKALAPTFGIDMALGQLENDDASFAVWQSWLILQEILNGIAILIWIIAAVIIFVQVYKYIKNKNKEN